MDTRRCTEHGLDRLRGMYWHGSDHHRGWSLSEPNWFGSTQYGTFCVIIFDFVRLVSDLFILFILMLVTILQLGYCARCTCLHLSHTCHDVTSVGYVQCVANMFVPLFIGSVVCARLSCFSGRIAPSRTVYLVAITLLGIHGDGGDCDYTVWDSGDMAPLCGRRHTWMHGIWIHGRPMCWI